MKKVLISGFLALFVWVAYAQNPVVSKIVFSSEAVASGTNAVSSIISLGLMKPDGSFAAQITVTGDGTVDFTYECSIDGASFVEGGTIYDDFSVTSGPGSDGKDVKEFYPETSKYIRFRAAATTSNMVVSASVAIQ